MYFCFASFELRLSEPKHVGASGGKRAMPVKVFEQIQQLKLFFNNSNNIKEFFKLWNLLLVARFEKLFFTMKDA